MLLTHHTNTQNEPVQAMFKHTHALTVATFIFPAAALFAQLKTEGTSPDPKPTEPILVLEKLVTDGAAGDPNGVISQPPIGTVVGFARKLEDTPRSVSIISSELIDKLGIRDADQFYRILPGTYTINVYNIVGAAQVRNNVGDLYIRGMMHPQSNIRNVMTMWDRVEIVRGPPSPIYGGGRIGGYTNYVPKSVRGSTGKYLDQPNGSVSVIAASYNRAEAQVNYAAPLKVMGQDAGIQIFALSNDSESFYEGNFQKDRVVQASVTMNLTDRWHLETGGIYQTARNAGMAGANRITQSTLDNGTYLRGTALVNLDSNSDGHVSEKEIQDSRTFADGSRSTVIRPLILAFPFVPGGRPTVAGVPKALQDLLRLPQYAAAAASPQGQAILAAPVGGPLAFTGTSGASIAAATQQLTTGMFLNPATLRYEPRDWSLVAIEELQLGRIYTGYLDFIDDSDADATQKLQFFYDYQHESKTSQLPFTRIQEITVLETKYTATRNSDRIPFLKNLPSWFNADLLASLNVRYTDGGGTSSSGDYDHRRDLVTGALPTDTFASFLVAGDRSFETGEPPSTVVYTDRYEYGGGVLTDIKLGQRLSLMGGARYDYVQAYSKQGARFNRSGASAATGGYLPPDEGEGNDSGTSASGSISYKLPWYGLTPYFTMSRANASLSATNQSISTALTRTGNLLGEGSMSEVGFKGSTLKNKLYYAVAAYEQRRSSNVDVEGEQTIRSTVNRGTEVELRWVPNRNLSIILSGAWTKVERRGLSGFRNANATAAYIGFQDLKDVNGNVIVPADAFLYGGMATVAIPATATDYNEYGQYPDQVLGGFIGYNWNNGWGVTLNSSYVSGVAASPDLFDLLSLPSYFTHNVSLSYDNKKSWRFSLSIRNLTDKLYFTPNNGAVGGTLILAGLPRNMELTMTRRF